MKNKISHVLWSAVLALLLLVSCDKQFTETNTSPNDVTNIPSEYLFANAVRQTFLSNSVVDFIFGGQYAHVYVGTNNARYIDNYFDYFSSAEYRTAFEHFYLGPIRNISKVIELTNPGGEQENSTRNAMACIVSIVNYMQLTDMFGSVPYKDGGMGQNNILYPKFDSVESIYTDMLAQLKDKIGILKTADPQKAYPGADPLYFNDLSKWIRFANSLRLRMAMRIRFKNPQLAQTVVKECLENPLIEENSQNAMIACQNSDITEFQNPMYDSYNHWKWKMSKLFVDQLKNTSDPRLKVFVTPNEKNEYLGIPNGLSDNSFSEWDWNMTSNPTENLVGKAAPAYFMSASEIWLLRAEAAMANIAGTDANTLYRKGIQKSLEQWNVPQTEVDGFMQLAHTTLTGSQEQQLSKICTQLWIAYTPNTFEAWCNIRRTGYPFIEKRFAPVYEPGASDGNLPKRLCYPSIEANINRDNYNKAIEQQGPDKITTALWWDVRD
jgi:hypothetical protein